MEKTEKTEKIKNNSGIPLESKNIFSIIFLTYPYKIIKSYSKKTGYNLNLLYKLKKSLIYEYNFPDFMKYFKKNKNKKSFFKIVLSYFFKLWFYSFILFFIYNFIGIGIPFLIRELINWFVEENSSSKNGYIICIILFFVVIIKSFGIQHALKLTHELNVQLHHVIFGIIFNKIKKIKLNNMKYINSGQIASTLTIDIYRITHAARTSHQLFIAPLMVIINSILIIYTIGWVGILGVAVIFILNFISLYFTIFSSKILKRFFNKENEIY